MTAEIYGANTPIVPDETVEKWLGKEPPVKKMTKKEFIQKQIEELQTALKLLEIEESRKTPCEKAYRDAYGKFPVADSMSGGDNDYVAWNAFQKGWEAQKEYHTNDVENELQEQEPPMPFMINCVLDGCPPEGYVTWHEWFNEMGSKGMLHKLRISSIEYKNQEELSKLQVNEWSYKFTDKK